MLLAPSAGFPLLISALDAATLPLIDRRSNAAKQIASTTHVMLTDMYTSISDAFMCITFDVRGGRKWAKPACGRPLDGGVRALG